MASTKKSIVYIEYEVIDGAHFFTGTDFISRGLCIASKDLDAAYRDVAIALKELATHNLKRSLSFTPSLSLPAFKSWLEETKKTSPLFSLVPWSFE